MMRNIFVLIFLYFGCFVFPQTKILPLIPQPNEITRKEGKFVLSPQTKIVFTDLTLQNEVIWFNSFISKNYGFLLVGIKYSPNR
jgi:hypothetical protein